MGFLKNLTDKAKASVENIKKNATKEDMKALLTDAMKEMAKGGDEGKLKALSKVAAGMGKMASSNYESTAEKLSKVHKDPADIRIAQETRAIFNQALMERLNSRKFIFESPEKIEELALFIIDTMPFEKDDTHLPKVCGYFDANGVHYDQQTMISEIKSFRSKKDVTTILTTRDQVDKFVFLDRMTQDEILAIPGGFMLQYDKDRIFKKSKPTMEYLTNEEKENATQYYCKYCGEGFPSLTYFNDENFKCKKHPAGWMQGPHKYGNYSE